MGSILPIDGNRTMDAVALGRICIDINPVDYFKKWGESTTFKKYVGGSPANTAVGLARLGRSVGFIGCVSNDQMGDFCLDFFNREGIDTSAIVRARHGESLGLAFTEILSEQESSIIMYRDHVADLQLEPSDVSEQYIKDAKVLLLSGTALSASPSREAALKALELAALHDTAVIFDIDYRPYTWKNLDEVAIYYAIASRYAQVIMGSREEYDLMRGLLKKDHTDEEIASALFAHKARLVIIKHGKEGSNAFTSDGDAYAVKPFPVKKLKSFGGGDGYSSACIAGLLEGKPVEDCLEMGTASASILVASHACSSDMPTPPVLEDFIKDASAKYGKMVSRLAR